ncbi:helix-turn-helix domain-containing protein [Arthrobacter sp. U41]|uniref:helix-turn-helix domain-containing protein n=1 Tax=Arthrobacter sp. U41 TaxID=1849032 RepID=UPI0008593AA5|nr:helix-turn-helix domain-containing protein [Arthrobacter sp. U41]AOT06055.1 hypothetical protein ASPU41_21685 [Arthrobacter sp. U41]
MSSKALTWAFSKELRQGAKFVLVTMADAADDDGYLFPSYEYLAHKTCLSQRSLVAAIKELVELGLVVCERNHHQDGSRAANLFFLLLENRKHASPVWRGAVSTKERKAQAERFRKEALANLTEQVPQETSSAESALRPDEGPAREPSLEETSGQVPQETSSAESALRSTGQGKNSGKPVVQNLHLGSTKVQNTSDLSANCVNASFKEPHDDLSHHHQSGRETAPAAEVVPVTVIDDEPAKHRGVDLAGLKHRLEPVLGPCRSEKLVWVIDEALSRATAKVSNPSAFIVKCVLNDPDRFAPAPAGSGPAAPAAGGATAAAGFAVVTRSRGLLGPGDTPCPKPDHGQYAADHCPACRTEYLVAATVLEPAPMSGDELAAWRAERAAKRSGPRVLERPRTVSGGVQV